MIAPQTLLTMTDVGTMHLGGLSFALLLTCNTAVGYSESHITSNEPVNIVEKMVCNGAETVIGFKEITYVSDCNKFAEDFIVETVQNGYSVSEAMGRISYNNYVKNMNNISEIGGNENLHLTVEDLT